MKKTTQAFIAFSLAFAIIVPVGAQTHDLPQAGTTPASPFFFIERFFEGMGTFFTFGNSAKAERHLSLARERLAEAQVLADEGDERAQIAVALYEEQYEKAKERATRVADQDLEARVTDAVTRHLSVLDGVLERVPEQAKASIRAAKERAISRQIETLRGIAQRDPETAVDIFARAADGRLNVAQARSNRGGNDDEDKSEDIEEAMAEFEQYAAFGNEISTLAQGIRTGETTVEELVRRATSHYRSVLEDVRSRAPQQAQQSIQRALDSADQLERRPIRQLPPQAEDPSGQELNFETILRGGSSGHDDRKNYVIKNNSEWSNLWDVVHSRSLPKPNLPTINFDNEMIIAVFQGTRSTGGYSIEITRIIEKDSSIEVIVRETSPSPESVVTQAVTQPYHIIKTRQSDKEVVISISSQNDNRRGAAPANPSGRR